MFNSIFFHKKLKKVFELDQEKISRIFDFNNIYIYKYLRTTEEKEIIKETIKTHDLIFVLIKNKQYDFLRELINENNIDVNWKEYLKVSVQCYEKFALFLLEEKKLKNEIDLNWIEKEVPINKRERYKALLRIYKF